MNISEIFESTTVSRKTIWTKKGNDIVKRTVDITDKIGIDARKQYQIKDEENGTQ